MKPHKNNARVAVKAAALPQRIPAKGDKAPPKTAQHRPNLRYTAPKPRGPVLENTFGKAVQTPTDKRGLVTPKFWGLVRLHCSPLVSGGMGQAARLAARLWTCYEHPAHLLPVVRQMVALVTPKGAKTMTTTTQGTTTPTPHHTTEERRAFAALEAANCAALARWYSARGNVKAARRKAVQLLAALAVLEGVQHA